MAAFGFVWMLDLIHTAFAYLLLIYLFLDYIYCLAYCVTFLQCSCLLIINQLSIKKNIGFKLRIEFPINFDC